MGMQGMTAIPPFTVTMDGPTWLSIETQLEGVTPSEALTWFTQPAKLRQWWGRRRSRSILCRAAPTS